MCIRLIGLELVFIKMDEQKVFFYPYKSDRKQGNIFNLALSSTSRARVLGFVRDSISHNSKFLIVTPNPEILLQAQPDSKLASILRRADIALPDGVALALAQKFFSLPNPKSRLLRFPVLFFEGLLVGFGIFIDRGWAIGSLKVIKGREMFLDLAKLANKKHWKIFLLGGRKGEGQEAAEILKRGLKGIKIECANGPLLSPIGEPVTLNDREDEKRIIEEINKFAPQILFVGLGAPRQEKWTAKWLPKLNVGGAMVVGGAFNYISGRASLPPKWMENYGLEWLWRLVTQPWRFVRIFNATVVFPLKVFQYKLNQ